MPPGFSHSTRAVGSGARHPGPDRAGWPQYGMGRRGGSSPLKQYAIGSRVEPDHSSTPRSALPGQSTHRRSVELGPPLRMPRSLPPLNFGGSCSRTSHRLLSLPLPSSAGQHGLTWDLASQLQPQWAARASAAILIREPLPHRLSRSPRAGESAEAAGGAPQVSSRQYLWADDGGVQSTLRVRPPS
ncbi:hypothetical protein NDU88_000524 [Pleurodeles waltl]|uniref:Uncharacterized protein n=1 Tax=Pleurodeles waltl TaxID=8319 RepID=A0AAV7N9S5_PLEWA|nr:hypothetical protein NDU88_000524 [Pleurodeles waltl]